jgi:hypothetical protein
MRTNRKSFVSRVLGSRRFWRFAAFPLLVVVSAALAFHFYSSSQGTSYTTHITTLSSSNAEKIQSDMQSGKPVLFVFCSGDMCTAVDKQLDPVAAKYADQLDVVQTDFKTVPSLVKEAAQQAGMIADPTLLLISGNSEFAVAGVQSSSYLENWLSTNLGVGNVIMVNSANEAQAMQALQSAKGNVLVVVGTPDILRAEQSAINTEAKKYSDSLLILEVSPDTQIAQSLAQSMGSQVFPTWVFINTQGGQLPYAGMLPNASALDQLIQAGLKAKPQEKSTPTPGNGTNGGGTGTTGDSGSNTATPGTGK